MVLPELRNQRNVHEETVLFGCEGLRKIEISEIQRLSGKLVRTCRETGSGCAALDSKDQDGGEYEPSDPVSESLISSSGSCSLLASCSVG